MQSVGVRSGVGRGGAGGEQAGAGVDPADGHWIGCGGVAVGALGADDDEDARSVCEAHGRRGDGRGAGAAERARSGVGRDRARGVFAGDRVDPADRGRVGGGVAPVDALGPDDDEDGRAVRAAQRRGGDRRRAGTAARRAVASGSARDWRDRYGSVLRVGLTAVGGEGAVTLERAVAVQALGLTGFAA